MLQLMLKTYFHERSSKSFVFVNFSTFRATRRKYPLPENKIKNEGKQISFKLQDILDYY